MIKDIVKKEGIALFGVADISKIREDTKFTSSLIEDLNYGISLGYRLSDRIIDGIVDKPNRRYLHHYRQVNLLLDQTTLKVTSFIQSKGFSALPIPASMITDWKEIEAEFSHKLIAYYAGLGWIGRSSLIVNPHLGSRIRFASVLTNLPLKVDEQVETGCSDCVECVKACPCGAIKASFEQFDKETCLAKLRSFAKAEGFGTQYICGICVKVCKGLTTR
ncbi:MAG: hypothetical protein QME40_07235 [bacterium]|nr:hypothetical protein [bacterium]